MTWFRVDDAMPEHPKLREIPRRHRAQALALWVGAGCYAARHLTDGLVSDETAIEIGIGPLGLTKATAQKCLSDLIRVRLWIESDRKDDRKRSEKDPKTIAFHDWADYQPTRAEVENRREKTRQRVRAHRARNGVTNAAPGPTRPDPSRTPSGVQGETTAEAVGFALRGELWDEWQAARGRSQLGPDKRPVARDTIPAVATAIAEACLGQHADLIGQSAQARGLQDWQWLLRVCADKHFAQGRDFLRGRGWSFETFHENLPGYLTEVYRDAEDARGAA